MWNVSSVKLTTEYTTHLLYLQNATNKLCWSPLSQQNIMHMLGKHNQMYTKNHQSFLRKTKADTFSEKEISKLTLGFWKDFFFSQNLNIECMMSLCTLFTDSCWIPKQNFEWASLSPSLSHTLSLSLSHTHTHTHSKFVASQNLAKNN